MTHDLGGGFNNTSKDAAYAFRAIMDALARPGYIAALGGLSPPDPLSIAQAGIALTLFDHETHIALKGRYGTDAVRAWLSFHTGTYFTVPEKADFIICDHDNIGPLDQLRQGSDEYPDQSATVITAYPRLSDGACRLTGPGINDEVMVSIADASPFRDGQRSFPLGVDFILTHDAHLMGLPRTTQMEMC